MHEFFSKYYLGNSLGSWLSVVGLFVLGWIGILLIRRVLLGRLKRWAERTKITWDDFAIMVFEKCIVPLLYAGLFFICLSGLPDHVK